MLKMKATPGGGYWLEVEGNLFEVVLDRSQVEGVYGGRLINNREYWCRVNGKRLAGGPYSAANYAKARLEPIIERVQRRAEIERERDRLRADLEKLFPGGLPENVTEAIEKFPQNESEPIPIRSRARPRMRRSRPRHPSPSPSRWRRSRSRRPPRRPLRCGSRRPRHAGVEPRTPRHPRRPRPRHGGQAWIFAEQGGGQGGDGRAAGEHGHEGGGCRRSLRVIHKRSPVDQESAGESLVSSKILIKNIVNRKDDHVHGSLTQLDYYWNFVRYNESRLEEAVQEVLHIIDLTPCGAREILTHDIRPSIRWSGKKKVSRIT